LAGAIPAKLGVGRAPSPAAGIAIPGIDVVSAARFAAADAAARASLRAFCAEAPIQIATSPSTATPSPRNTTKSFKSTPDSSCSRCRCA
jgi:hypothetical protein